MSNAKKDRAAVQKHSAHPNRCVKTKTSSTVARTKKDSGHRAAHGSADEPNRFSRGSNKEARKHAGSKRATTSRKQKAKTATANVARSTSKTKSPGAERLDRREQLNEYLYALDIGLKVWDGLDEAIIGVAEARWKRHSAVTYSLTKILDILQAQGMTYEEAYEHFDFNIGGGYIGKDTPLVIDDTMF